MESQRGAYQTQGSNDETAIRALLDRYAERWMSHDADGWMGLWDEEGVQMPPHDVMHVGREAVREANAPLIADRSISWKFIMEILEILLFDSGYALARGLYRLDGTSSSGAAPIAMDGKFMSVFKKQHDGSWLFYRDCFNSNTPLGPGA